MVRTMLEESAGVFRPGTFPYNENVAGPGACAAEINLL